jgi:transcriptional regulator with XRE-family HTH domain
MLDPLIVGNIIKSYREESGLSQEIASGFAGIARTHLSAIERGERKPTMETFCRICRALNIKSSVVLQAIEEATEHINTDHNVCTMMDDSI